MYTRTRTGRGVIQARKPRAIQPITEKPMDRALPIETIIANREFAKSRLAAFRQLLIDRGHIIPVEEP